MPVNYGPSIITNGLVLHFDAANIKSYPGTGVSILDLSGNNNTGTLVNGAVFNSNNILFDGVNDYISIPDSNSISLEGDLTLSIWINLSNISGYNALISKNNDLIAAPYEFYLLDGVPTLLRGNGTLSANFAATPQMVSINTWTNLSVTMISTTVNHYLNGILNGSGTLSTTITDINSPLYIGARGNNSYYCTGKISQIRIYNRALSQSEIQQNFNASRSRYGV